jgi:hypothetical protein
MALPFPPIILTFLICVQALNPGIHLPLYRREGRFTHHAPANLTYLTEVLRDVEARYMRSTRAVDGNSLVRQWRRRDRLDENDEQLVIGGGNGGW